MTLPKQLHEVLFKALHFSANFSTTAIAQKQTSYAPRKKKKKS